MRRNTPNDFWRHVNKTDGCWLWTASTNGGRYGKFSLAGKTVSAHRFSWELANGPITTAELFVCHKCDNVKCVNPAHLFLGTAGDNVRDCHNKGRQRDQRGEKHALTTIKERDVMEIRARHGTVPQKTLAKEYGVCQMTISNIVNRRTWKHI